MNERTFTMNKSVILFISAIIALTLTGCWSAANTETANSETTNVITNADPRMTADSNIQINTDPSVVNDPPSNAVNSDKPMMSEIQSNKVGNHIRSGEPGIDPKDFKDALKNRITSPAPENSVVWGEMNKDGNAVQTRKFAKNPTIDKIEIITLGSNQKKQLLYLKSGKIIEIAEDKNVDLINGSSYQIFQAAGIEVKSAPQTTNEKKKTN